MSEYKYQMTYLKGPINVTVRLDDKDQVVEAVADLVSQARKNIELTQQTPYQAKPVKDANEGTVCRTCGAERVLNPKTNKWFCKDKCWTK